MRSKAKVGYRTEGHYEGMDTEITGECCYYPIPRVSISIMTLLVFKYTKNTNINIYYSKSLENWIPQSSSIKYIKCEKCNTQSDWFIEF